jgi:hypothetical protein
MADAGRIGSVTDVDGASLHVGTDCGLMTLDDGSGFTVARLDAAQRGRLSALLARAEAACQRYRGGEER